MCLPGTVIIAAAPDFPEMSFRGCPLISAAENILFAPFTTLGISVLAALHFDFEFYLMIGLLALRLYFSAERVDFACDFMEFKFNLFHNCHTSKVECPYIISQLF